MNARNLNHRRVVAAAQIQQPSLNTEIFVLKVVIFMLLCGMPLYGSLVMGMNDNPNWWPLMSYGAISVWTFFLYRKDKQFARKKRWRIPEGTLHTLELFCGWPGALLAQQVFRHKTRKISYLLWFSLFVLLHQVYWFKHLFPIQAAFVYHKLLQILETARQQFGRLLDDHVRSGKSRNGPGL